MNIDYLKSQLQRTTELANSYHRSTMYSGILFLCALATLGVLVFLRDSVSFVAVGATVLIAIFSAVCLIAFNSKHTKAHRMHTAVYSQIEYTSLFLNSYPEYDEELQLDVLTEVYEYVSMHVHATGGYEQLHNDPKTFFAPLVRRLEEV